jgi:hypothetical protein
MEKPAMNYAAIARQAAGNTSTNSTGSSASTSSSSSNAFNSTEAARFLQERWTSTMAEVHAQGKAEEDKPKVYAPATSGKVWGQSKLHLQAAVGNFLAELQTALAKQPSSKVGA